MRVIIGTVCIIMSLTACRGTNEATTNATDTNKVVRKKTACSKLHVDMNQPHLDWYETDKTILHKANEILVLPKDFKVYSIDTAQLNSFFNSIGNGQTAVTAVPLPTPAECQLFTVALNKQAKNTGNTIVAIGKAKEQDLFINYFNNNMKAIIDWFDIKYEITSVSVQGLPYFIVYEKAPPPIDTNKNVNRAPSLNTRQVK